MAAKPRYASTVVLLRGEGKDRQVYMMKRREDMKFLGGFYVFPGGALDHEDCSSRAIERVRGLSEGDAGRILEIPVEGPYSALGFWTAGIRELFEEAGVLLAEREGGEMVTFGSRPDDYQAYRIKLHRNASFFYDILRKESLYCAAGRLKHIDHWITPEFSPIRFDTRFFLATLPEGQEPSPNSGEAVEGLWIGPEEALDRFEAGDMAMIPPTIATLSNLRI